MRRALSWLIVLLALLAVQGISAHQHREAVEQTAAQVWEEMEAEGARAATTLNEALDARAAAVTTAAQAAQAVLDANPDALDPAALDAALSTVAQAQHQEIGAYLLPAWRGPYARLFVPGAAGPTLGWDRAADYADPTNQSWHQGLINGAGWLSYTDPADTQLYAQHAVPLTQADPAGGRRTVGLVFVRYPRVEIEALVSGLGLTRTGYAFVLTDAGGLIGHPLVDSAAGLYTAATLSERLHDESLRLVGQRAILGEAGQLRDAELIQDTDPSSTDAPSPQHRRWSYRPIPSAGWSLVTVIPEEEALRPGVEALQFELHHRLGWLAVVYAALGAAVGLTIADPLRRRQVHAALLSLLLAAGINQQWQVGMAADHLGDASVFLLDPSGVERYLAQQERKLYGLADDADAGLLRIPAGVHLQSIEFQSANNLVLTGIAWERMRTETAARARPGFYFPEAVEQEVEEIYRRPIVEGGVAVGETIGYRFHLVVRENFDFDRYPFDMKDVWLRMLPVDFDGDAVLVPDLEAYPLINPSALPGLEHDVVLAGWQPLQSYFRYRDNSYSTNFGIREYVGRAGFPELYFTVDLRRDFINAFVSDIIPLLVVACLLYGVLATATANSERMDALGFNFTNALAACSGLVFVVLLAHIQLRSILPGQHYTYLEWYYFAMYVTIILVALNAWLVVMPNAPRLIRYHDNELARLTFWPVLMGFLFAVTSLYFYPQG